MAAPRSESQQPQYGRKRSNTVQSIYKPPPIVPAIPLKTGDTKVLTTWVHDPKESSVVILNPTWWPGVADGDMIRLSAQPSEQGPGSSVLFLSQKDEAVKHQLQVSVPRPMADWLGLRNNGEVLLTKVEPEKWNADYIELTFQDQYLGRNEMWRINQHLVGQCVHVNQELSFIGVVSAKVHAIYIAGKQVSTACVSSRTKLVYRSLSARATIFIQVCRELWEFAGDGERYNEKIVHSFLPALFARWRDAGTTHVVTIVLISRVYYDDSELEYAAGPLRRDDDNRWYKDFFKVITDLEVVYDWKPTLVNLKESFWDFQRDILLAHHYHRATVTSDMQSQSHAKQDSGSNPDPENVRLVGQLSYAHDGPILEALNLSFNPLETHYIDRSLSLTGSTTIIITPGTGYFRVNKQLLRLTTTRLLDQGFALDLVSLTKPPLHQSPIFAFRGYEPEAITGLGSGSRTLDALWAAEDQANPEKSDRKLVTFWWEPFWLSVSFWDRQMDLPFREDRFVARAKMQEIEMLGLLDHDVLSSIELPYLPDLVDPAATPNPRTLHASISSASSMGIIMKVEADKFDCDIFSYEKPAVQHVARNSVVSLSANSTGSSYRGSNEGLKRSLSVANRLSDPSRITTIEESPYRPSVDLPSTRTEPIGIGEQHAEKTLPVLSPSISGNSNLLSTSPSQSSVMSSRTARSTSSTLSVGTSITKVASRSSSTARPTPTKGSSVSRFAPSWLWSPFSRSGISQPETSAVSASGVTSPLTSSPLSAQPIASTSHSHAQGQLQAKQQLQPPVQSQALQRSPKPMKIQSSTIGRSGLGRMAEEDSLTPHRGSLTRQTPLNTPPRDEIPFVKRRSGTLSSIIPPMGSSSSPITRTNPSRPLSAVPLAQSALARRWEHMFPRPLSKHDIKWKSMITPGCLPLTVEYMPSGYELEHKYIVSPYDFVVDPPEMRSWLFLPPVVNSGHPETVRRAWALAVMRTMVALRLAQGFQFVLASSTPAASAPVLNDSVGTLRRTTSYTPATDDDMISKFAGAPEVLRNVVDPIYLSMSNEIHRIAYSGDSIQVRRYVKRMPRVTPYEYQCLIWPKLGVGYTELRTSFVPHGLENYSWNRLDMLSAGYESQLNESLRYWRTRFVVMPADEPPLSSVGPPGEKLSDEEIRLLGMDKLAELFTKARWIPPDERGRSAPPPVRFLPTDLGPTQCVLDETLLTQLDEIHAAGPLRKKMRSERDIADTSLAAIAKAMREEDGVPMKDRRWHGRVYAHSFTGSDFVAWLVREFRDVPTREQATEWGMKLQEQGLFDHCRGAHGFLDGHYFYALRGEYLVPMTPRGGWFRSSRHVSGDESTSRNNSQKPTPTKKSRKKLILSQSMVIDIDPQKKSDQAEHVVLHHDIIHNPLTCFHFELHWVGTTARCIDDAVRAWARAIERYGLRLVEAYVQPIADVRARNAFQSCFPIPLALAPPHIPNLAARVPEGVPSGERHYFECALLRRMGFVLDCEPPEAYPEAVDVVYSYRRVPFRHAQYVHRDGVAFVQVLGGKDGFLFLTNRLIAPSRAGLGPGAGRKPHAEAEDLRLRLHKFCQDEEGLRAFYDEEIAMLGSAGVEEEPPELNI